MSKIYSKDETTKLWFEYKINEVLDSVKYYANEGDSTNLYRLGYCYICGFGLKQDYLKAKDCFLEVVKKTASANSYYNLGSIYYNGLGVEKDIDRAIYYFEKSLEIKPTVSAFLLGIIYYSEKINYELAFKYFNIASTIDLQNSKNKSILYYYFGEMYSNGHGIKKDTNKAIKYYIQSDELGNEEACEKLGIIFLNNQEYFYAIKYLKKAYEFDLDCLDKLNDAYKNYAKKLLEENEKEQAINLIYELISYLKEKLDDNEISYYSNIGDLYYFLYYNFEKNDEWYKEAKQHYINGEKLGSQYCTLSKIYMEIDWENIGLFDFLDNNEDK